MPRRSSCGRRSDKFEGKDIDAIGLVAAAQPLAEGEPLLWPCAAGPLAHSDRLNAFAPKIQVRLVGDGDGFGVRSALVEDGSAPLITPGTQLATGVGKFKSVPLFAPGLELVAVVPLVSSNFR